MGFFKDTFWPSREERLNKDIEDLLRKIESNRKTIEVSKHNLALLKRAAGPSQSQILSKKLFIDQCQKSIVFDKKNYLD